MGPEPGTNAHGLVGARIVLARGRVAVAPTITAAMVTLPLSCCRAVMVRPPPRHHRVAVLLPLRPRCRVAVAPTLLLSWSRCGHHGHAIATTLPSLRPSPPSWSHCRCVAVALLRLLCGGPDAWAGPEPWHQRSRPYRRMRCPCSRSCCSCAVAVAELLLQPLPSLRSPCCHVAIVPSRSRCHCALAGNRHAYAPRAVPRCLVGLVGRPWLCDLVG